MVAEDERTPAETLLVELEADAAAGTAGAAALADTLRKAGGCPTTGAYS
jgi:hypothetical protein